MVDDELLPEAAEAIRIADKHLPGYPPRRRMALALEIQQAIVQHAGTIAAAAIKTATGKDQALTHPLNCNRRTHMTVASLIELLSKLPQTAPVKAWDADSEQYEGVTGLVWADDGSEVYVQTDDAR